MVDVPRSYFHRLSSSPKAFPILASLYPPLLGAGIRVRDIAPDWTRGTLSIHVMRYTANANGAAFGGALFSATDVLYGSLLAGQLGEGYQVWTRSATIDFLRPGKGTMTCVVEVPASEAADIRERLATQSGISVEHTARLRAKDGHVVAEARHTMRVRRRR